MALRIGIIDVGAANRASIAAAVERAGGTPSFITCARDLQQSEALIFPGVANFGYVSDEMDRRSLREPLNSALAAGTPYFGICVGFQILFAASDEAPGARGLEMYGQTVRHLRGPKMPHMGWNTVERRAGGGVAGWAYFAHDYVVPEVAKATGITKYGQTFTSLLEDGPIVGVQFHPERSGAYGARLLERFVAAARCVRAG